MKKFNKTIWFVILGYLALGYVLPVFFRARFMLLLMTVVSILVLLELEWEKRIYALIATLVLALFFYKIIPSPYHYFVTQKMPMSISIFLTILTIFLVVTIASLVAKLLIGQKNVPKL
jgi:hypothetical protein